MSQEQIYDRRHFLTNAALSMAAPFSIRSLMMQQGKPASVDFSLVRELSALDSATGWLNSSPLNSADLRGKIVLINFWTYTCINWIRSLPYVRAWAQKYKPYGLVVIGVHTPEFTFEQNVDNVRWSTKELQVDYPVAIDSDYTIWRAFRNQYWPALYFINGKGQIRHQQFGEGEYERSEQVIQQLLKEAGKANIPTDLVKVNPQGAELAADWNSLQSPENYVGYARTENFASPGGIMRNKHSIYTTPRQLRLNQWALTGDWTIEEQAVIMNKANGAITCRFHARDLHLVLGPASREKPVRFLVRIDGQPPETAQGIDVDREGNGVVTKQRMYQLIRQQKPITDRQFEIEFLDPGVEAFAFTFG